MMSFCYDVTDPTHFLNLALFLTRPHPLRLWPLQMFDPPWCMCAFSLQSHSSHSVKPMIVMAGDGRERTKSEEHDEVLRSFGLEPTKPVEGGVNGAGIG